MTPTTTPTPPLADSPVDTQRPGFFTDVWQRFFVQLKTFLRIIPQRNVSWNPVDKIVTDTGYIALQGEVVLANAVGGAMSILLPTAAWNAEGTLTGGSVTVKKTDASANVVTIDGNGTNIDGAATQPLLAQWNSKTMVYTGAAWVVTASV